MVEADLAVAGSNGAGRPLAQRLLESLRMVIDRRDERTRQRVQTVDRLHRLLAELIPGTAKKDITALQAKAKLASVRPRDLAGKTLWACSSVETGRDWSEWTCEPSRGRVVSPSHARRLGDQASELVNATVTIPRRECSGGDKTHHRGTLTAA
jgi:hypothetical protein